ncbi:MAG: TPM domain-containing protein [Candidatus Aminicenantales bacterium]
MKKRLFAFLLAAGLLLPGLSAGAVPQGSDIPAAPGRWVTDRAGFLASGTVAELDSELESFERQTGRQVIVYIDRTTGGIPIEDWAGQAFRNWKVGRKGLDDGLALFVMADDRAIRIEVGYGLESVVPDITAGRVINDVMIPAIRNGENDRADRDAVRTLLGVISGGEGPGGEAAGREQSPGRRRISSGEMILGVIAIVFFLILFITNPSLALWLLFSFLSGGRGGGGGRGGFSGGGGRSGGGGASGHW